MGQIAPLRHGVASVHRQVHHHLLQLPGVSQDVARVLVQIQLERHLLPDEAEEEILEPSEEPVQVNDPRLHDLAAAEGEELRGQGGRPRGGASNLFQVRDDSGVRVRGRARSHVRDRQLGIAPDRHQQVVEVVRDPARQTTDGLHLLRLAELFLQAFPLRHVPHDRQVAAGKDMRPGAELGLARTAVGADDPKDARLAALAQEGRPVSLHLPARLRVDEVVDSAIGQGSAAQAQELTRSIVGIDEAPLVVGDDNRVEGVLEDGLEASSLPLDCSQCVLALGDVTDQRDDLPLREPHDAGLEVAVGPVPRELVLELLRTTCSGDDFDRLHDAIGHRGRQDLGHAPAQELLRRKDRIEGRRLVVEDRSVVAHPEHRVGYGLDDGCILCLRSSEHLCLRLNLAIVGLVAARRPAQEGKERHEETHQHEDEHRRDSFARSLDLVGHRLVALVERNDPGGLPAAADVRGGIALEHLRPSVPEIREQAPDIVMTARSETPSQLAEVARHPADQRRVGRVRDPSAAAVEVREHNPLRGDVATEPAIELGTPVPRHRPLEVGALGHLWHTGPNRGQRVECGVALRLHG